MKLLQEANFDLKNLVEGEEKKELTFSGPFIQMDIVNRNRRFYPSDEIAPIVEEYIQDKVLTGSAVGEADHPTNPNLNVDRISHRITELKREGNTYVGKALVLDTPMGKVLKGLHQGGVRYGVSTRAVGKVTETAEGYEKVGTPFILVTAGDVVMSPSAPDAYVQAVMESQEWVISAEGTWIPRIVEKTKELIESAPSSEIKKVSFECYQAFISNIAKYRL